jgi:hypothetical protein
VRNVRVITGFHQKLLGRFWVLSHMHLLTPYITWIWYLNSLIFSEIAHCTEMGVWRINYTFYKLFRKLYREIHLLPVLCYSSCWKWTPICWQISHWYTSNKFCDTCWSSSSELCRITFQISICKASRACSLFPNYVSW